MAGNARKIDEIIDQAAVDRQFGSLMEWLKQTKATIESMPKLFDGYKNSSGSDSKKALTEMSEGMQMAQKSTTELSLALKEHQKNLAALANTQAKANALSSETASQLASEREALRQRTQEVKNSTTANNAAEGSIQQLRAALSLLTAAYDKMGAAERNSAKGNDLQLKIKAQSDALKKLEADTGRYGRNVGNYTGAIKTLEKALVETKQKIDDFTNSGNTNQEVFSQLEKEQELLAQVLERNEKGFASLTMEVRTNERALATMFAEGMQNTEAFNALQLATSKAKRELTEFQQSEKLLASTAPALQASMIAAKGLAGTYAIGAGAAALFADGNEKVEKELNKLVAVMTVLQGLNEVHELLEKRLAIAKIFSAGGTAIQTAALKVYTYVTEAATVATKAFRAVLVSTGLGALLVLLSSFADKMNDAKEATDRSKDALRDYDRAIQDVNEDLEMANKISEANANKMKEHVKQRAGSEGDITKLTQKQLLEQIANKKLANDKLSDLEEDLRRDRDKIGDADNKENKKKLEEIDKQTQAILKEKNKNLMDIFDDGVKLNAEGEKEKTRLADEGRKSAKANADASITDLERQQLKYKAVMADEKATYAARLDAANQFYALQAQIEKRKENVSLMTANLTSGEVAKIKADYKKAMAEIGNAHAEENKKLFEQEKQRTISAQLEMFQSSMERRKEFEQQMFNDDKRALWERLAAYDEFSKNERKLIDAEWQYKRNQPGLIQKEIEALDQVHQDKLAVIEMKGIMERKRIVESGLKTGLDKMGVQIEVGSNDAQVLAINRLNQQFKDGKINAEQYAKAMKEIEETAKDTSLKLMASALEDTIAKMKTAGIDATQLEATLSNIRKEIVTNEGAHNIKVHNETAEKRKKILDGIVAYEGLASEAIKGIVDGQSELRLNAIQKELDANTIQKNKEIEGINASTLSAQDKAARIAIINATAQAKEDQLNKKKKDEQIKQAQFDKGMQEFNMGLKLIVDTVEAIANPKKWLDVAADSAALIAIAAKPVPKYAIGTDNHPGGAAIVGEIGTEIVQTPDGKSFLTPSSPTLMNLPQGAKVIPHDEVNHMILNDMMRRQATSLMGSPDVVNELRSMRDLQMWQTGKLVKALGDKQPVNVTVINNGELNDYIKRQVYE